MVEDRDVFHKTAKGQAEIATPGGGLSPKQRRCLILVDGAKDAGTLAAMFRPGEINTLLTELQAGGYIAGEGGESGAAAAALEEPGGANVPMDQKGFEALRARAAEEVSHRLGPNGDPLAEKIEAASSPRELQVALRDAERTLEMFLGANGAKAFLKKLGL